jgi:hypothetical protein
MENLFVFFATTLVLRARTTKFKRYLILPGCSALLNSASKKLQIRCTRDGDRLYFNEHVEDGITYGMICIDMNDEYTLHQAEDIMMQYVRRACKPLKIRSNVFMETEAEEGLVQLTDYWQDADGKDWKVKAQTNGKIIALLYVRNITETTVKNHDAYLNGFRFSASRY